MEDIFSLILSEIRTILEELISTLSMVVPRILLASMVLVIGWLVGRLLGRLVALVVKHGGIESTFAETGIGKGLAKAGLTFSEIFDLLTRATVYILAIGLAIRTLGFEEAVTAAQSIIILVGQIVAGGAIFLVGLLVVEKMMDIVERIVEKQNAEARIITLTVHALLIILVIFAALSQLDPRLNPATTFFTAFAWGLGAGLGVATVIMLLLAFREEVEKVLSRIREMSARREV